MKVSVKKDVHNGIQPIRVLKHNITTRLVNRNQKYIQELQVNSKLDNKITYHGENQSLSEGQTPFINKKGTISIHETFLSYIWIICYYFFVLYEEILVIPDTIRKGGKPRKKQNKELCERAKELFDYGISLIKTYSDWDKKYFPNPEYYDKDDEEGWHIERTNDLFVEVMNFILYHEMAHAELEHIKKRKENNLIDDVKEMELEADRQAADKILLSKKSQEMTELSIVIGVASLIFFKNNLSGGKLHPDIDIRLNNVINVFKPNDEHPLWAILYLFLKNWSNQFNLGLDEKGSYDNYKQLYDRLLSQV